MNLKMMLKLLHTLEQLRNHERWTRQQLETYQSEQLRDLRRYAYTHSPFYQQFHKGLEGRPLHELPVLTKAMLMEHFDDLVTDRALRLADIRAYATQGEAGKRYRNRYWVNATSGSSGQPGFFVFNDTEWATILASFARGQEWSGVRINLTQQQRMATVASISPWHVSSQVAAVAKSWWRPSLRLPASQPLPQTVEQLNTWQPDVLIAYASMAGILAEEQLAMRLHIHPHVVYTSSEVLTPQTRARVQQAWGDEPFDQYGATETADIAAEYRACRRMHIFEDLVLAEVVDERNRPVPPGAYGARILITTLFSRTQPLIRHALDDSVRISAEPHDCGLPFAVLENVQGRKEEALELPGVAGGRVSVQPLVFNRVMDIVPVSGWQLIQETDDRLTLLVTGVHDGLTDAALRDQLAQSLAQERVAVPAIRIEHVAAISKTAAGKTPLIASRRPIERL
jgi:phenylacetate-coenzyme A ligase PaaK-like adenylate-forming protein